MLGNLENYKPLNEQMIMKSTEFFYLDRTFDS